MAQHYQADVLIVGGGIAGVTVALELLDRGFGGRILMLDRDAPEGFGGLAREAFGGMFFVDTPEQRRGRFRDSPDLAWRDWQSFAEYGPGEEWPRAWGRAYVERCTDQVYRWLRARGIRFLPVVNWVERGQYRPGNSVPRFHMVWGTGRFLADTLVARLRRHPRADAVTTLFGHRVEELTTSAGCIDGCRGRCEGDGGEFEASAGAVIVATGGINGDLGQVRRHWHGDWSSPPAVILNGAHRFADGTLHRAVERRGGSVTHLDRMWNYAAGVHHPAPTRPGHGLSLVPCRSALWLNSRGERIGPEPLISGFDTRELITRICREPGQYSWQVLNRRIAVREFAISGSEHNPAIRDRRRLAFVRTILFGNPALVDDMLANCIDFVSADTPAALAQQMNALTGSREVDPGVLERELRQWDEHLERGKAFHNDNQLRRLAQMRRYRGDRMRLCRGPKILDPGAAPLIAIREFIVSRKSLGGIRTDLNSRVLDTAGDPIPGLYAVGEAAGFGGGGMHGLRALEGTFLGGCVLSGRIAGRSIAEGG